MIQAEYKIVMPYIGGILSKNAYKWKTRGTKPSVRAWMNQLAIKVKYVDIPKTDKYEVEVFGMFTDERRPDISNLFIVISDSVAKGLGVNDKHFKLIDKGYQVGVFDPVVEITIIPVGDSK